jgi:hypothetical protein
MIKSRCLEKEVYWLNMVNILNLKTMIQHPYSPLLYKAPLAQIQKTNS